jgi:hypothetical protein
MLSDIAQVLAALRRGVEPASREVAEGGEKRAACLNSGFAFAGWQMSSQIAVFWAEGS